MTEVFSQDQLGAMKQEFITLLRSTGRPGIENLINWMETQTDFFVAPASQGYHGCFPGGLLSHSLNVYHAAVKFREMYKELALPERRIAEIPDDSLIISTLLHDLCKANIYKEDFKWFKDENNKWHQYMSYKIDDAVPWGHGEKSCLLMQYHIFLNVAEIAAVRWHMHGCDAFMTNPTNTYEYKSLMSALETFPLTLIVAQSDMAASFMMEEKIDQKVVNLIS